ncbi:MAG: DNA polymerase III subunit gamma/tau [Flavobacteriales bacterium]|nr:DNA polymerase III subunit gamma/tau [Flavobacteriales bacterium]
MDQFIVSARKYRPSRFETVIGQDAITVTLKNAIRNNHLAQAFLFCGPRGVGKTTCARILAKTINCESLTEEGEACDSCSSCKSFNEGKSLNVFELDAASNNHVEDIRSLIDQVRFSPQAGKYKVYIIDEVHMLSQQAFNAFLKTLEEPPAHAKFILATTEKHKVLPTILSRCQIFDFKRVTVEDIARHLAFVAEHEGIQADMEALHIIAQKSDGALRDALSTFDQLVSFGGNRLTYEEVIENLNILDHDYFFKVIDQVVTGDQTGALLLLDEVIRRGFDGHNFINGLNEHIRNLLVCKDPQTIPLIEASQNIRERYLAQTNECSYDFLLRALDLGNSADLQYRTSKNPRFLVELLLLKMTALTSPAAGEDGPPKAKVVQRSAAPAPAAKPKAKEEPKAERKEATPPPPQPPVQEVRKEDVKAPEAVKPEQPKPVAQPKQPTQTNTISIKTILSEEAESAKNTDSDDAGESTDVNTTAPAGAPTFSEEDLAKHWKDFAEQAKANGKRNLGATMLKRLPDIKDSQTIHLMLDNRALEEILEVEKSDILRYLREKLALSALMLTTEVKIDAPDETPYTPRDKFEKMAEKNPNINKLKQQLDLDIDY